jgi:hypothetical protein
MIEIEESLRRNAAVLRDDVARAVDLEASFADLRARGRRRRTRVVAGSAAAAAAVAVIGAVGAIGVMGSTEPSPAPSPAPLPSTPFVCEAGPTVHCLSGGRIRVDRPQSFTLTPPDGFTSNVSVAGHGAELYRGDTVENAGVTFLDDVLPARSGGRHLSARQLASWIAARPYLGARPGPDTTLGPSHTTVDGRPAWEVQATTPRGPDGQTEGCNWGTQPTCWPLLAAAREGAPRWEVGPRPGMVNRFTVVDAPDGATFVIWSWALDGDWAVIDANQDLVATLHFVS